MFDDIFTTVDMPTASEIGRLAHQTGFAVWAFLKQIVVTQNEGFLDKISQRLDLRTLRSEQMNMRALISAFDSDFAILEDAGRNKFSMAGLISGFLDA